MTHRTTLLMTLLTALTVSAFARPSLAAPYDDARGEITYSGTLWQKGENNIKGHWFVEEREDGSRYLHLGDDFSTKKAPDLKVILAEREPDALDKRNVLSSGTVIGPLESHKGAQLFEIPDSVSLDEVLSIAIHCEQYTVFWGAAPFNAGKVVAASAEWTKKSESVKGAYEIAETDEGYVLRTSAEFSTKKAPDLKFVLSGHSTRAAKSRNALQGGTILAPLASHKGAHEYALPDGVEPSSFSTLLIHCEQYSKLWAAAPLTSSE